MKELYTALAKAQATMTKLVKTETAQVQTKGGSQYSYSYANLADVLDIVRPALNEQGIALIQGAPEIQYEGNCAMVTVMTTLAHESGDVLVEPLTLRSTDMSPQGVGSAITYARRYSLQMLAGLYPDSDDDGAAASKTQAQRVPERRPKPQTVSNPPAPSTNGNGPHSLDELPSDAGGADNPFVDENPDILAKAEIILGELRQGATNMAELVTAAYNWGATQPKWKHENHFEAAWAKHNEDRPASAKDRKQWLINWIAYVMNHADGEPVAIETN